jgi:hypothetical protein
MVSSQLSSRNHGPRKLNVAQIRGTHRGASPPRSLPSPPPPTSRTGQVAAVSESAFIGASVREAPSVSNNVPAWLPEWSTSVGDFVCVVVCIVVFVVGHLYYAIYTRWAAFYPLQAKLNRFDPTSASRLVKEAQAPTAAPATSATRSSFTSMWDTVRSSMKDQTLVDDQERERSRKAQAERFTSYRRRASTMWRLSDRCSGRRFSEEKQSPVHLADGSAVDSTATSPSGGSPSGWRVARNPSPSGGSRAARDPSPSGCRAARPRPPPAASGAEEQPKVRKLSWAGGLDTTNLTA